jgi:hypothetical protein
MGMPLFGGETDPGSDAFRPCPECGEDQIYSQSDGLLSDTIYQCDSCGCKAKKGEVKKSFKELRREKQHGKQDSVSIRDESSIQSLVNRADGPGITVERLKIDDGVILHSLDNGEVPHCIIKGAGWRGIEVETGDEIQRSGHKGAGMMKTFNNKLTVPNLTIATDRRLLALHPLRSGTDEYTIPYDSIDNVNIDRGWTKRRIQVSTRSRTYYFEVRGSDHDKIRPSVDFIRQKREEAVSNPKNNSEGTESSMEKLERLSDLHERGAISESEFEEKKQELLEEI